MRSSLRRRWSKYAWTRYRLAGLEAVLPKLSPAAEVNVDEADHVILRTSRLLRPTPIQTYLSELAFAQAVVGAGRSFAFCDDPSTLFEKSVVWFPPAGERPGLMTPALWDYSRQAAEFALGLEAQGNRPFCSAQETQYWENKVFMHREFSKAGVPAPETRVVTATTWQSEPFDFEPLLVKEEHSSSSEGVHHFDTADEARAFVAAYRFRPNESLLTQAVVAGATKDLRLTMVGSRMIPDASYWRIKSPEVLREHTFRTTATSFGSRVLHGEIPTEVPRLTAEWMQSLGLRTAGVDLMWEDDDLTRRPFVLEVSPYYQPNPRKPQRYDSWSYKRYKGARRNIEQSYLAEQFAVFQSIAAAALDQGLL